MWVIAITARVPAVQSVGYRGKFCHGISAHHGLPVHLRITGMGGDFSNFTTDLQQ